MSTKRDSKRILSVTIKRMIDDSPDTSYLGEFSDSWGEFAIVNRGEYEGQFYEELPCECGHERSQHNDEGECTATDCEGCIEFDQVGVERGRSYRFFNSASVDDDNTDEENRKYAMQDYERMRGLDRGDWGYIGIQAQAEVSFMANGRGLIQRIHSGGLWGIESDATDSDFEEIETEQLDELKDQLHAIGFSKRAIAAAFRNVERKEF